jgi:hypothetical protein
MPAWIISGLEIIPAAGLSLQLFAQALGGVAVIDRGHLVHAAGKGQLIKGCELILAQGL